MIRLFEFKHFYHTHKLSVKLVTSCTLLKQSIHPDKIF